jgi:uncharacterized delta-60 repeat protein
VLDQTFGAGGKVTTDFAGAIDSASDLLVQTDGKIVVVGDVGPAGDFGLARYTTEGVLDPSFGVGGKATTDFGAADSAATVAVQHDGKLVVAGSTASGFGTSDFAVARYTTDGQLDPTFGTGGLVRTDFDGDDIAIGVAVQADGKVVAAGRSIPSTRGGAVLALARYGVDGSLDGSFGVAGKVTSDFGNPTTIALSVAVQPDQKIVTFGWTASALNDGDFAVGRFNPDGTPDASFGTGGKAITGFGSNDIASDGVIQPDGKIVLAGWTGAQEFEDLALARFNGDGSLDTGFGSSGKVVTDLFGRTGDQAFGVALQPNGKIVAAGRARVFINTGFEGGFAIVRYEPDGLLDPTFGNGGKAVADFGPGADLANDVVLQPDGKIVAAGFSPSLRDFSIARFDGDSADSAPPETTITGGPAEGSFSNSPTASLTFSGSDDTTPTADLTFECSFDAGVFAPCGTPYLVGPQPDGRHTFSVRALDRAGNVDSTPATRTWTVDTVAPAVDCAPNVAELWPPNHRLVAISVTVAVSDANGPVGVTLAGVASSQADSGLGTEDVPNDVQGWTTDTDDRSGLLRAERFGVARAYELTYRAADAAGNTARCTAIVRVPRDRSGG